MREVGNTDKHNLLGMAQSYLMSVDEQHCTRIQTVSAVIILVKSSDGGFAT